MDARTQIARSAASAAALVLCLSVACDGAQRGAKDPERPASCPQTRRLEPPMPHVEPEHQTAAYWIARNERYGPLDEPIMDARAVARHNLALQQPRDGERLGQSPLLAKLDPVVLREQVDERLAYLREALEAATLVDENGDALDPDEIAAHFAPPEALGEPLGWRAVETLEPLRCGPHDGSLYRQPIDPDFDRNRCSTLRVGELVQILASWPNGMRLARTSYALGWLREDALSAPLERAEVEARLEERQRRSLTRRALLTEAFSMLGQRYGWGGKDGGYDCSRFLLELLGRFGIALPRHSAKQARAGTFSLDVSTVGDLNEKRLLIEAAARRGIVLLHFPGHIMLYLGTTEAGSPMAIHAFSEFLTPCEGTDLETVNRVDRIAVSDLTLGQGSSRRDFLSRITRVTVLGNSPGRALIADAELRPNAPISPPEGRCNDSKRIAVFRSPLRPDATRPLRVIVTSEPDPGPAALVLFDPNGEEIRPHQYRLDGPPFGRWVEVSEPMPGRWTAVFADGDRLLACDRINVTKHPRPAAARNAPGPVWKVDAQWGRDTENLYSAFIEHLFREPTEEDATWPDLQALVGERERNLLYDYRDEGEDADLALEPDCADLPYFLRAYFAWKLRLPFVYRMCTRGRADSAPVCETSVASNLDPVPDRTDTAAFRRFARRIANTVHSSSPRTLPNDDETDFYPVRLRRQSLRPGTVYADPYGHVLVVARWKPQGVTDYGVLIGADAQPDGTVGRRRFWRGSFLFTPKTDVVGAGFKVWRPVRYDHASTDDPWRIPTNDELRDAKGIRAWSDMQYRETTDDFYSRMEGLINPRPLDPVRMQLSLVDALEESVQRRLSSVQNGEDYMRAQGHAVMEMPRGSALFLTTGPWEDYSTPSRDMRLLVSIDAVVSFPRSVADHPERFGVERARRDEAEQRLREALRAELLARRFEYVRSDGSSWTLTLADVVDRTKALETAYNPNDCIEIRWGAPEASEERITCERRAPEDQQARMERYRAWFAKRERPG